jgi:ATP-binding cassette subfamily B protein
MRKFSVIRQHDSIQCGIAYSQMICNYFGKEYTIDFLTKLCFATTEGVSLLGINEAANTIGLRTISARTTIAMFDEAPLPCILHWNQNHFVVLYKVKKLFPISPRKNFTHFSYVPEISTEASPVK